MSHHIYLFKYSTHKTTYCSDYKEVNPVGTLRYGFSVDKVYHHPAIHHHGFNWYHIKCVDDKMAKHAISEAASAGKSLKDWLVIPPPPSTGGDGPEGVVVDTFISYLQALAYNVDHNDPSSKHSRQLLKVLEETISFLHVDLDKKLRANIDPASQSVAAEIADLSVLDKQIRENKEVLKFLSNEDLKSICTNHSLQYASKDTRKELLEMLWKYY